MKRLNAFASLPIVIFIVLVSVSLSSATISAASLPPDESPPCYSRLKLVLVLDVRAGLDTGLDVECMCQCSRFDLLANTHGDFATLNL
jgi:hypothetical protein